MVFKKSIIFFTLINFACNVQEMDLNEIIENNNIVKIKFVHKDNTLIESNNLTKIISFLNFFLDAEEDKSSDDFKSFFFIYLMDSKEGIYRFDIFGNRFRFNRKRYEVDFNIKDKFNSVFVGHKI